MTADHQAVVVVASDEAAEINRLHAEAQRHADQAVELARAAGRLLLEQRARLGHGAWLPWLKDNVAFCARTAQRYMNAAAPLEVKNDSLSHLKASRPRGRTPKRGSKADKELHALRQIDHQRKVMAHVAYLIAELPNLDTEALRTDMENDGPNATLLDDLRLQLGSVLRAAEERGSRRPRARRATVPPASADRLPGTPLVRGLLTRLEIIANEMAGSGLAPQQYAERFRDEFDWSEPILVARLERAGLAIAALASLSMMNAQAVR